MAETKIVMHVRKVDDGASIVDIEGVLTAACERTLMDAYTEASGNLTRAIILNFGGLEYMNSGGIGLLVTLLIRVNRQQQRLLAYGLDEHYREILALTRLDETIGIHESESAALAATGAS